MHLNSSKVWSVNYIENIVLLRNEKVDFEPNKKIVRLASKLLVAAEQRTIS